MGTGAARGVERFADGIRIGMIFLPMDLSLNLRRYMRIAAVLSLAPMIAGCGEQKQASAPPPPSVTVAEPTKRTVFDYDEYVGRFVAVNSVEMRARVSGYLDAVDFTDGQMVKQGDLLFTIDKRPFQNAVAQARANLVLAQSNVTYTEADFQRAQQLVRDKTITEQAFDQRSQAFRNAQASVTASEAAVRQAELDLQFTELRAPIDGRIGDRRVSPGNLVAGGTGGNATTLLATIVSLNPIRFEFTFDEASFLRYQRTAGQDVASRGAGVPIALKLIDESDYDRSGRMDFIDNVIDRSTGTIRGRGTFENTAGLFTPGMFGRVRVPGSPPYEALLVPDAAIGTEQTRKFVLAVGADNKLVQKYVTLGQATPDNLRVIKTGIGPNDKMVVNGLMRVRAGQVVSPHAEGQQPAPPSAAQPAK
jgi:RND family efflux transporter MFP subunit